MDTETDLLLERIADGDSSAANVLLERYRPRVRRLIDVRIDDRVRGRFDASDVVQEAFTKAGAKLTEFAQNPQIPFYPWLRRIAIDRLLDLHRRHLDAARRSVKREISIDPQLSNASHLILANLIADQEKNKQKLKARRELAQQMIDRLSQADRETLVLRYLEQTSNKEAAAILGISENAFAKRHVRALYNVRKLIEAAEKGNG